MDNQKFNILKLFLKIKCKCIFFGAKDGNKKPFSRFGSTGIGVGKSVGSTGARSTMIGAGPFVGRVD